MAAGDLASTRGHTDKHLVLPTSYIYHRLHFPTARLGGGAGMTGSPLCRRGNRVPERRAKTFCGHQRLPGAALKLAHPSIHFYLVWVSALHPPIFSHFSLPPQESTQWKMELTPNYLGAKHMLYVGSPSFPCLSVHSLSPLSLKTHFCKQHVRTEETC